MSPTISPIRVKLLSKNPKRDVSHGWLRFLPDRSPLFRDCHFIFDRDCREYDWLVVYDDLPPVSNGPHQHWEEVLACPRENTMLVTTEPASIKLYGKGYIGQFGWVLSSQEKWAVQHSNLIHRQPGLIRFYEGEQNEVVASNPEKSRTLSTVCSLKRQTHTLHKARYDFTQRLKAAMPDMDVFGHGVRPIEKKNEALDPYHYHIAIENHVAPHHWTEKLADAFWGKCLCFYHGAPNAADYFPSDSFIPIDIHNFEGSLEIIQDAIASDEYTRRLPALEEARQQLIDRWSTFSQLADLVHARSQENKLIGQGGSGSILARHAWRRASLVNGLAYAVELCGSKLKSRFFQASKI